MYILSIENGEIDYNEDKRIYDSGYHQEDITNGIITTLQYIPNFKEVNRIINIVKDDAIDIHVYKMVKIHLKENIQKKLKKRADKFFDF